MSYPEVQRMKTTVNIVQMTQYRIKYLQDRNAEDKEKMYKHAFLSVAGIACLLTIGIANYHRR